MRAFEDLTLLRAFVCIVECGSISLNVTHNSIERGSANPKGIPPQSPGLARSAYPGNATSQVTTSKGLRPASERSIRNPFGVGTCFASNPQGSSFLATLGFVSESRWDSAEQLIEFVGNVEGRAQRRPRFNLSASTGATLPLPSASAKSPAHLHITGRRG